MSASDGEYWLDKPESVNLLIKILIAACVMSVLADFTYHKHAYFHFMELFAFDAVFGFVAYVGLVTSAKGLRKILMRDEDYYGDVSAQVEADAEAASDASSSGPASSSGLGSSSGFGDEKGGAPHA